MAKLNLPSPKPQATELAGLDLEAFLHEGLRMWREARGYDGPVPHPAPEGDADAVSWWLDSVADLWRRHGAVRGQQRYPPSTADAVGMRHAFLAWLDLPSAEREAVVSGVTEDRVPYRGESFGTYMRIWQETHRMREIGVDAYRQEAIEGIKKVLGRLL